MLPSMDALLQEHLVLFLMAAFIGTSLSWMAWKAGYYLLPPQIPAATPILWQQVFGAFALFLGIQLIAVPLLFAAWLAIKQGGILFSLQIDSETQGWVNLLGMVCTAIALLIYFCKMALSYRYQVWGNRQFLANFGMGVVTWIIAYPWVIAISQLIGLIEEFGFQSPHIDQVAVKHLKDAFTHPALLWLTVIMIATIIPCVEELLFRGFLQGWLKGHFGTTRAILITSTVFAVFHFSSSQGLDNIELLASLFLLSCYLGFIRERQNSLWASIGLHSTFNTFSLLLIFLYG